MNLNNLAIEPFTKTIKYFFKKNLHCSLYAFVPSLKCIIIFSTD